MCLCSVLHLTTNKWLKSSRAAVSVYSNLDSFYKKIEFQRNPFHFKLLVSIPEIMKSKVLLRELHIYRTSKGE